MDDFRVSYVCHKLRVEDPSKIEIEIKKKLSADSAQELQQFLAGKKGVKHIKSAVFMDQFLDTPKHDIFHAGASLRIRCKGDGSNVYLQYKGHGFTYKGILFRSEFSSGQIQGFVRKESHCALMPFSNIGLPEIMERFVPKDMRVTMCKHIGNSVLRQVVAAPVICFYRKDKYLADLGQVAIEPSLDHISAFQINGGAFHSLCDFWEYENELKSKDNDLTAKIANLDRMVEFDAVLADKFSLQPEGLDKYHRILGYFMTASTKEAKPFAESVAELAI